MCHFLCRLWGSEVKRQTTINIWRGRPPLLEINQAREENSFKVRGRLTPERPDLCSQSIFEAHLFLPLTSPVAAYRILAIKRSVFRNLTLWGSKGYSTWKEHVFPFSSVLFSFSLARSLDMVYNLGLWSTSLSYDLPSLVTIYLCLLLQRHANLGRSEDNNFCCPQEGSLLMTAYPPFCSNKPLCLDGRGFWWSIFVFEMRHFRRHPRAWDKKNETIGKSVFQEKNWKRGWLLVIYPTFQRKKCRRALKENTR